MDGPIDIISGEFWIKRWEETLTGTPYRVHKGYATPRYWDNASKDYDSHDSERSRAQIQSFVDISRNNGVIFEGAKVLDIGCGTGRLAFALAKEGADVTAIDFSDGMLDTMKNKTPEKLESRIHPIKADWEAVDLSECGWEKAFDLVVAHMTPAVRRPSSFLKMIDASKGACILKGWAGRRRNSLLEGLWRHLNGEDMKDRPPDIIFEFNLLYAMNYYPSLTFEKVAWERDVPVEDAVTHYMDYFSGVSDEPEEALRNKISSYIESLAADGTVHEKTVGRTGLMVWRVD